MGVPGAEHGAKREQGDGGADPEDGHLPDHELAHQRPAQEVHGVSARVARAARLWALVLLSAASPAAAEEPGGSAPAVYDCRTDGADTLRIEPAGRLTLLSGSDVVAEGTLALPFPFAASRGGAACAGSRITIFAQSEDGKQSFLVKLVREGARLLEEPKTPVRGDACEDERRWADEADPLDGAPWLKLGDCLWAAERKADARQAYLTSARLMPARSWPKNLVRRCPECEPRAR
jgi:hypothetical protein